MFVALLLREIQFLVTHHSLAFPVLVLILFFCGVATNATVSPFASAAVVCCVSGEGSHQGCLGQDRLRNFLHGRFHLRKMDVDRTADSTAAAL